MTHLRITTSTVTTPVLTTLLSAVFATTPVFATGGNDSPGIDKREHVQKQRIVQGVKTGQLTPRETGRLLREQQRNHKKEAYFKADGKLTGKERVRLHQSLNRSSRHIYGQKHDAQHRHTGAGFRQPARVISSGINKRQQNQFRRIGQGIRSGELTAAETRRLGKQQARIQKQKRHFKSDGHFSRQERFKVHKNLNRSSRQIYRQKHDRQRR